MFIEKIFFKKIHPTEFLNFSNYYLNKKFLDLDNNIISAGIANDISFEKEVLKNTKVNKMICIDPTNVSKKVMEEITSDKFFFVKSALYHKSELTKIYYPFDKDNLNLSIDNLYNSNNFELIETVTIEKIMKMYDLNRIDILKLDIEGVSDKVINSLIQNKIFPKQIAFEIERPSSFLRQYQFFKRLFFLIKTLKKNYNLFSYTKSKLGFRVEVIASLKK